MQSAAQRQNRAAAEEAAVMVITMSADDFADIMLNAIRQSTLSDAEIEDFANRLGRIPHERKWHE